MLRIVAVEVCVLGLRMQKKPKFEARTLQRDLDAVIRCQSESFVEIVLVDVHHSPILIERRAPTPLLLSEISCPLIYRRQDDSLRCGASVRGNGYDDAVPIQPVEMVYVLHLGSLAFCKDSDLKPICIGRRLP
jgi:hypothetical protein